MGGERTVIVTGGTKGIGAAIARTFYASGAHVVMGARSDNDLAKELGERAQFWPMDVCKPSEQRALVQAALDWTGRIDGFINNAGVSACGPLCKGDRRILLLEIKTKFNGAV